MDSVNEDHKEMFWLYMAYACYLRNIVHLKNGLVWSTLAGLSNDHNEDYRSVTFICAMLDVDFLSN